MTFDEAVRRADLRALGYAYTSPNTGKTELIPAKVGMSLVVSSGRLFHDFEVRHDSRGFLAMVTRTAGLGPGKQVEVLYRDVFDSFNLAMAVVNQKLEEFFRGRLEA